MSGRLWPECIKKGGADRDLGLPLVQDEGVAATSVRGWGNREYLEVGRGGVGDEPFLLNRYNRLSCVAIYPLPKGCLRCSGLQFYNM